MLILETIIATLALWLLFIPVATLKNKVLDRYDHLVVKLALYPIGAAFWLVDVIFNKTYGCILFWELGELGDLTLTSRLRHILLSGKYDRHSWRFQLARFMCHRMIEPWDPDHCSLSRL